MQNVSIECTDEEWQGTASARVQIHNPLMSQQKLGLKEEIVAEFFILPYIVFYLKGLAANQT